MMLVPREMTRVIDMFSVMWSANILNDKHGAMRLFLNTDMTGGMNDWVLCTMRGMNMPITCAVYTLII